MESTEGPRLVLDQYKTTNIRHVVFGYFTSEEIKADTENTG